MVKKERDRIRKSNKKTKTAYFQHLLTKKYQDDQSNKIKKHFGCAKLFFSQKKLLQSVMHFLPLWSGVRRGTHQGQPAFCLPTLRVFYACKLPGMPDRNHPRKKKGKKSLKKGGMQSKNEWRILFKLIWHEKMDAI